MVHCTAKLTQKKIVFENPKRENKGIEEKGVHVMNKGSGFWVEILNGFKV